ncbi:protein ABHD11 [Drosophila grimshawi]|uniref:sn-1-specific diacylglycerol lipase ABHD11 n=1 Tax=Drosophila grimshawi TaxID=7222 RepID=B4JFG6_DROGR|nr:protein ABHD11 [Drosophila grimshawi]EDV93447.1 GH18268 [Drosophila grimshawi]
MTVGEKSLHYVVRVNLLLRTYSRLTSSNSRSSSSSSSRSSNSEEPVKMDYTVYQMPHSQLKSPPILLLHGLNMNRSIWRRTARHLAKLGSRWVIAVDARNHGDSPHRSRHTPESIAADVEAFISDHKLGRVVGLGHNMGGRALMTLALTRPELVERLVVVDITPGPLPQIVLGTLELLRLMLSVAPKIPKHLTLDEAQRSIIPAFSKLVKNDLYLLRIIQNLKKLESGTFDWNVNAQAIIDSWEESMVNYEQTLSHLEPYHGETLLIAGNKVKCVTPANVEIMRTYFPNLQVEHLDAGHQVHLDQPQQLVQLVVNFTRSCTHCLD